MKMCTPVLVTTVLAAAAAAPASAESTAALAISLGITPESLVIAGLHDDTETVLGRLDRATSERTLLSQRIAAANDACDLVSALRTRIANSKADAGLRQEYESAVSALAEHRTEIAAMQTSLLEAAMSGMPSVAIDRLRFWRAGARYRVAGALRAVQRSRGDWMAIERATRVEERATRRGEEVPVEDAEVLQNARLDQRVIEAENALVLYAADVEATFLVYASE